MSDETANQLRAWAASGLTKNLFSETKPLCDTLAQAAAHIEALQAQLAEVTARAEFAEEAWATKQAGEVWRLMGQLAEARAGLAEVVRIVPRHAAADAARATLAKIGGGE
jgi:hypothetical protein